MPLILNVGLSRKVGEANYSSRGANVNVQLELDSNLVARPDELHGRIRQLFSLAREAVAEELRGQGGVSDKPANGNGAPEPPPRATAAQVRALEAISRQERVVLVDLLREQFGLNRPEQLSKQQASVLIDELKGRAAKGAAR
jgi:hypothetical protein